MLVLKNKDGTNTYKPVKEKQETDYMIESSDEYKRRMIIRMNRAIGQVNSIKRMILEDYDYRDIAMQVSASCSALNAVRTEAINRYIITKLDPEDKDEIESFTKVIRNILK